MSYRNNRFNTGMHSIEFSLAAYCDSSKSRYMSDNGIGVKQIIDALDDYPDDRIGEMRDEREAREQRFAIDCFKIVLIVFNQCHLLNALDLIVRNGSHRSESIAAMTSKTAVAKERLYFRHRDALCTFLGIIP